ncbi:cytochrome P450 9e2-like [Leptopilina boulardi]|uniref:cytochrome P450 9e2-like n=1 Tax=Leptopilina boulardi TaxID=63433 RepID=UPI0021F67ED4|nr:cytochrome P450 9e2-like [Leptopilina boulardi]
MIINILTVILTIFIGCFVIYIFFNYKKLNYLKIHGIPHVTPLPILGNLASIVFRQKHTGEFQLKLYNKFSNSKYFGYYDFQTPVIVLRDIELIKSIGVKNFESFQDHRLFFDDSSDPMFSRNLFALKGQKWHDVRILLSPAFTSNKMKIMFKLISECAINFAEFLSNDEKKNNKIRDIKDCFTRYTNDVIATCAFGINVDSMKNPKNEFYLMGIDVTDPVKMSIKFIFLRMFPKLLKFFNIRFISMKIEKFFTNVISTTINMRDKNEISRPDMLQLMMDSRGESNKIQLTSVEMTAQAFVFFFGGFDTISTHVSFVAYELALNSKIQMKLQEEINFVLQITNNNPSYEAINGMEYLDAVISECLRKYPIVPFVDRVCNKQFELPPNQPDSKPFIIEPGMSIMIPIYAIQHDLSYYEEPEKFNPDRFLNTGNASNKSATFLAFGLGPRQCIGNRFAVLETKIVLFHLLARCNLKVCKKTNVPLKLSKKTFTLTAVGGYWLEIEKRNVKCNSRK